VPFEGGIIRIELLRVTEGEVLLCVSDNGNGLPPPVDPETSETFGMQLVTALVDQLHGSLEVNRDAGTTFRIVFPLETPTFVERRLNHGTTQRTP